MPEQMSAEHRRTFLSRGTASAVLATTRSDGSPHAVPIWYALDGDDVLINTGEETAKAAHLRRDPRAAVLVHDDAPPYAFAMIHGVAEIVTEPAEIRRGAELIARRYLPAEAVASWVTYATSPGKVLVRVRPTHVIAVDHVGG